MGEGLEEGGLSVTTQWPWPGDSPLVRARKCAWAYRAALAELKPEIAQELDERLGRKWGERWITGTPVAYEPDDWVTSKEAGEILGMSPGRVGQLRIQGRIKAVLEGGKRFKYRVSDVYALSETVRRRGWNLNQGSQKANTSDRVGADGPRAPTAPDVVSERQRKINEDLQILRREWEPTVATGMVQCVAKVCLSTTSWIQVGTEWDLDYVPHVGRYNRIRPVHAKCKVNMP